MLFLEVGVSSKMSVKSFVASDGSLRGDTVRLGPGDGNEVAEDLLSMAAGFLPGGGGDLGAFRNAGATSRCNDCAARLGVSMPKPTGSLGRKPALAIAASSSFRVGSFTGDLGCLDSAGCGE